MLNKRQRIILTLIEKKQNITAKQILDVLSGEVEHVSKPTLMRDLKLLLDKKLIVKKGKGRSVTYESKQKKEVLKYIDVEEYFKKRVDERDIINDFHWEVFNHLKDLFTHREVDHLTGRNETYVSRLKKMNEAAIKREYERLTIELSWKSSELEGNTYSLIDTEFLIKEKKEAKGHTKEEAIMILNHKTALDFIFHNRMYFKHVTPKKIRELHSLIVKDLDVPSDYRSILVGIVGTRYRPLDNKFQITEAVDKMCQVIEDENFILAKAMLSALLISYIQPFVDGNKRIGRLLANAILLANNWCPLSYRSVDGSEYKKAMLLFYEQNNARYFKELFIKQFEFATKNYFC